MRDIHGKKITQAKINLAKQVAKFGVDSLLPDWQPPKNEALPKLLRAIANGSDAKASKQDVILNAAADELDYLRKKFYGKS